MRRISIPQLEAFYWTAELGSVQKAAEKLNVAQPTLSLRLRQLDASISSPVLERAGRGVRLTREGHTFLRHTKLVLTAHRELHASSRVAEVSGPLRFGLAGGFAAICLPRIIAALRDEFPLLRPEWTVDTSTGLSRACLTVDSTSPSWSIRSASETSGFPHWASKGISGRQRFNPVCAAVNRRMILAV